MRECIDSGTTNHYERELLRFARNGNLYVVECTQEGMEPCRTAFATLAEARVEVGRMTAGTGFNHAIFRLHVDQDGDVEVEY